MITSEFTVTGRIGNVKQFEKSTIVSIGTDQEYKDKQTGKWETRTIWVDVTILNEKLREIFHNGTGRQGNLITARGLLTNTKFQDRAGNDQYKLSAILDSYKVHHYVKKEEAKKKK